MTGQQLIDQLGEEKARYWAQLQMPEKRYNVTVEFAHGVVHTFADVEEGVRRDMDDWLVGANEWRHEPWFMVRTPDGVYQLNRDYVCTVKFEDVSG